MTSIMKIITDSTFHIGATHTVCEDYAIAGSASNDAHCAVVSDGCSSASMSDIGSRVLALSAIHTLLEWEGGEDEELRETILGRSLASLRALGVSDESALQMLHATLMWVEYRGDLLQMRGWGDGALLCLDSRTGNFKVYLWDQPQNTPPYPIYHIFAPSYWEKMGDTPLVQTILSGTRQEEGFHTIEESEVQDANVAWDVSEFDIAVVFSDGFSTFFPGNNTLENRLAFIRLLLSRILDTVPTPGFLRRCVRKTLKIMRSTDQVTHMDDLSAAGIWVHEVPEDVEVSDEQQPETDLHQE